MSDFNKYPKIANQQKATLEPGLYSVQAKLDGSNAGVYLDFDDEGGALVVHSRTRLLARINHNGVTWLNEAGNFGPLVESVSVAYADGLAYWMQLQHISHIYGEFLVKHTILYPTEMYGKFYPFDLTTNTGRFCSVEPYRQALEKFGFKPIAQELVELKAPIAPSTLREVTERKRRETLGHRIEGTVWKRYDLDELGQLNRYGDRHCYKDVLPEFREDHRTTFGGRSTGSVLEVLPEELLVQALPDRALEKVYQKVCDANGGWQNKHIPMFMGMVCQEWLEEWAASALRTLKFPTINTAALKKLLDIRAREFALAQPTKELAHA